MADASNEAKVLWFLQTCDGPVPDLKSIIVEHLRDTVDELARRGFIERAWVITDAGQEFAEREWKESERGKKPFILKQPDSVSARR